MFILDRQKVTNAILKKGHHRNSVKNAITAALLKLEEIENSIPKMSITKRDLLGPYVFEKILRSHTDSTSIEITMKNYPIKISRNKDKMFLITAETDNDMSIEITDKKRSSIFKTGYYIILQKEGTGSTSIMKPPETVNGPAASGIMVLQREKSIEIRFEANGNVFPEYERLRRVAEVIDILFGDVYRRVAFGKTKTPFECAKR